MSMFLTNKDFKAGDMFQAVYYNYPDDYSTDLKIKWRFFYQDLSYLNSRPKHTIFGVIRDGLFYNVE